jgi:hypothetical protein
MRRARQLRGRYVLLAFLTYPILFLLVLTHPILFLLVTVKAFNRQFTSYAPTIMSFREVAIWAAVGTVFIVVAAFYRDKRKH